MLCGVGWKKFDGNCYFVSRLSRTWAESRLDCISRGADLVVINSREEQVRLTDSNFNEAFTWWDINVCLTEFLALLVLHTKRLCYAKVIRLRMFWGCFPTSHTSCWQCVQDTMKSQGYERILLCNTAFWKYIFWEIPVMSMTILVLTNRYSWMVYWGPARMRGLVWAIILRKENGFGWMGPPSLQGKFVLFEHFPIRCSHFQVSLSSKEGWGWKKKIPRISCDATWVMFMSEFEGLSCVTGSGRLGSPTASVTKTAVKSRQNHLSY